jgi:hypothetical protein
MTERRQPIRAGAAFPFAILHVAPEEAHDPAYEAADSLESEPDHDA